MIGPESWDRMLEFERFDLVPDDVLKNREFLETAD